MLWTSALEAAGLFITVAFAVTAFNDPRVARLSDRTSRFLDYVMLVAAVIAGFFFLLAGVLALRNSLGI